MGNTFLRTIHTIDFKVKGDLPKLENNDRADDLGIDLVKFFSKELKKRPLCSNVNHIQMLMY